MPNQHADGKVKLNVWVSLEEKQILQDAADAKGFATLTDYIKWVGEQSDLIPENPNQGPPPKKKPR